MPELDPSEPITMTTTVTIGGFADSRFTFTGGPDGFCVSITNSEQLRRLDVAALSDEDAFALTILLSKLHLKAFA